MRLAAVSFNYEPDQIGGGHIPAIAFMEWCHILGIECVLHSGMDDYDFEDYDGIFFCTPPNRKALKLNVPYVVMIHAEFDAYDMDVMERALAVVVIDQTKTYWPFKHQLYWHPCCSPKHLLKGDEIFPLSKRGTLYAARVSTWKNANTLAAYSNLDVFQDFYGPVTVYGKANNQEFGHFVNDAKSRFYRVDRLYTPDSIVKEYMEHAFFWDVSGTNSYNLNIKRLNLSAFEAMKHGCIPIVNKDSIPESLHSFTIDFRAIFPAPQNPFTLESMRNKMLVEATGSYFGYRAVQKQVESIIEVFQSCQKR